MLSIVLISGCIEGEGLIVRTPVGEDALELSIDAEGKTTFDSLEPFIITLRAENFGSFDAENLQSQLQGYDGITAYDGKSLSLEKPLSPSLLEKPGEEQEMPGGSGYVDWDVYSPYVEETAPNLELILTGEVFYDYRSLATQKVVVITRDHLEKLEKIGEEIPVTPETEALNGPVAVSVEASWPYVKMIEYQKEFRVKVTLDNDGSGNVYNPDMEEYDYLNSITMRVPLGLAVDEDHCDFVVTTGDADSFDEEKILTIDEDNNEQKLRLTEGGATRDLHCRLIADEDYVGGYNTFELYVSAYYTYLQSVSKKLIITGTEESPLNVRIVSPTDSEPDDWTEAGNNEVNFKLYYQNREVTSATALNTTDIDFRLTNGAVSNWAHPVSIDYDTDEKYWSALCTTPDMGEEEGTFGITIKVSYADIFGSDRESGSVNYHPLP